MDCWRTLLKNTCRNNDRTGKSVKANTEYGCQVLFQGAAILRLKASNKVGNGTRGQDVKSHFFEYRSSTPLANVWGNEGSGKRLYSNKGPRIWKSDTSNHLVTICLSVYLYIYPHLPNHWFNEVAQVNHEEN